MNDDEGCGTSGKLIKEIYLIGFSFGGGFISMSSDSGWDAVSEVIEEGLRELEFLCFHLYPKMCELVNS